MPPKKNCIYGTSSRWRRSRSREFAVQNGANCTRYGNYVHRRVNRGYLLQGHHRHKRHYQEKWSKLHQPYVSYCSELQPHLHSDEPIWTPPYCNTTSIDHASKLIVLTSMIASASKYILSNGNLFGQVRRLQTCARNARDVLEKYPMDKRVPNGDEPHLHSNETRACAGKDARTGVFNSDLEDNRQQMVHGQ